MEVDSVLPADPGAPSGTPEILPAATLRFTHQALVRGISADLSRIAGYPAEPAYNELNDRVAR